MRYEWDDKKNKANKIKHGINFESAVLVFKDPNQLSIQDRYEKGEERWQTLGSVNGIVVILVAHTYREKNGEEVIRIISARKATEHERQRYEKNY